MPDHPRPSHSTAGEPEDNEKAPLHNHARYVKISDYGAMHVEQHYGQVLKQIAPPSEPDGNTDWTVSSDYDPRIIFAEVIPPANQSIADKFARVELTFNKLDGSSGTDTYEVAIPNLAPRFCAGLKKIKVIAGRVTIYGGYTHPESE